ncbi:MAG: cyclic nucleotide-binding domain-containing protein [Deltaproteobacteria bacterium]|nr:cyclic nucleotide-binding domain-containing protein [Deltaproteobacteria bacterium]
MANGIDISQIKDKAEKYFSKGQFSSSLDAYLSIKTQAGKDPRIYLRLGDIYRKLNKSQEAVEEYKNAAEVFVKQGFIVKAIAVFKMIIDIDPSKTDVQKRLADLYAKQGLGQKPEPIPAKIEGPKPEAPPAERKKKIPRTPLFSDLNADELSEVIDKINVANFSNGDFVFKEGDKGESIYIIAAGTVEVICRDKDGKEIVVDKLGEGDFFGEFGFFSHGIRMASIRAAGNVDILELSKDRMNAIAEMHRPRVSEVLFDFYKERVADRLLALSPLFGQLTAKDRKVVLSKVIPEAYEAGDIIIKEGEIGDAMYLIKDGSVEVSSYDSKKGKVVVAALKEGEFFGEIGLATMKPRTATVTAITKTELVLFSRIMIKEIIERYPAAKKVLEGFVKSRVTDIAKLKSGTVLT